MYCRSCGTECTNNAKYCENCGESLQNLHEPANNFIQNDYSYNRVLPPSKAPAIISMIFGIFSLMTFCVLFISIPLAIISIILGAVSISSHRSRGYGCPMGTAGIVCSSIGVALGLLFVLLCDAMTGMDGSYLYMLEEIFEEIFDF